MRQKFKGKARSPFGDLWLVWDEEGIQRIDFADQAENADDAVGCRRADREAVARLESLLHQLPVEIERFALTGSDFQRQVWQQLLTIPAGTLTTYQKVADAIGRPKAVRAVASAIAANPIAWLIPCHRVIRSDGGLGGYRWGVERKQAMLDWERKLGRAVA
ncbi:methylated-DNA--[protein]-cysteine S-methyltransferase [Porticoccus sp.]